MASVRFENVSISYGAKQVVKDFSLSVNDGEITGHHRPLRLRQNDADPRALRPD